MYVSMRLNVYILQITAISFTVSLVILSIFARYLRRRKRELKKPFSNKSPLSAIVPNIFEICEGKKYIYIFKKGKF